MENVFQRSQDYCNDGGENRLSLLELLIPGVILIGGAFGIFTLIKSGGYKRKTPGALKNIIAFILGAISGLFAPAFLVVVTKVQAIFTGESGFIFQVVLFIANAAGSIGCIAAGLYVYFGLCNKSKFGKGLGVALYIVMATLCVLATYGQFIVGDILKGVYWIFAVAAGLLALVYLVVHFEEDDDIKDTDII
jgi:hypothetical protein